MAKSSVGRWLGGGGGGLDGGLWRRCGWERAEREEFGVVARSRVGPVAWGWAGACDVALVWLGEVSVACRI